jgi:hypothetical protein
VLPAHVLGRSLDQPLSRRGADRNDGDQPTVAALFEIGLRRMPLRTIARIRIEYSASVSDKDARSGSVPAVSGNGVAMAVSMIAAEAIDAPTNPIRNCLRFIAFLFRAMHEEWATIRGVSSFV